MTKPDIKQFFDEIGLTKGVEKMVKFYESDFNELKFVKSIKKEVLDDLDSQGCGKCLSYRQTKEKHLNSRNTENDNKQK